MNAKVFFVLAALCLMADANVTPPCACPYVLAPVCGTNGVQYDNKCMLSCMGATWAYDGECGSNGTPLTGK